MNPIDGFGRAVNGYALDELSRLRYSCCCNRDKSSPARDG